MPKASLAIRIVQELEAKGHLTWPGGPQNAKIHRLYAGRHQRAAGAWVWDLKPVAARQLSLYPSVGSQWPATTIARGFEVLRDQWGDLSLFPKDL